MDNERNKFYVEIFRPGSFQSMEGTDIVFDDKAVADIAEQYDRDVSDAPAVIGHPITSDPAYGWVKSLSFDRKKKRLVAELDQVDNNFAEAVKAGRYKKISPSFFQPNAPANPKPGHYYLRHVGFLGAAAPAVPGLKPASFAGAAHDAITFNMDFSEMNENKGLLGRFKTWLIEKIGADQADALLTEEEENKLLAASSDSDDENKQETNETPASNEADVPVVVEDKPTDDDKSKSEKKKNSATSFAENRLSAREKELAQREKIVADREKKAIHDANVSFAARLVTKGSLLPINKDKLVDVLDAVDGGVQSLSFSEGETVATGDVIRQILSDQPEIISFGQCVPQGGALEENISFATPDNYSVDPERMNVHRLALALQKQKPELSYDKAVAIIERGA